MKQLILIGIINLLFTVQLLPAQPRLPFTAYMGNPILHKGNPGQWDSYIVFLPKVIADDSLYMFYTGNNQFPTVTPNAIGYASSSDGYNYTKSLPYPILTGDGSGFDSAGVTTGAPTIQGDSIILYYNGYRTLGEVAIGRCAAIGPAGPWIRRTNPVLQKGSSGEWDAGWISVNKVLKIDNEYIMFYTGALSPPPGGIGRMIGMASSADGINWNKYDDPTTTAPPYAESDPVLKPGSTGSWDDDHVWLPSVLLTSQGLEMFYNGGNQSSGGIGYATSNDGILWEKSGNNPIFTINDDPYALSTGGIIEAPSVVLKDSTYLMYYDYGLIVGEIGMATSIRKPMILNIPADYPSIQAGINAAIEGDTVLVSDSTYYENINFKGKAITVASLFIMDGDTNHINNTIIDGSQPSNPDSGSVVYFVSGEDTNAVLCGFTITNGTGTTSSNDKFGGGIFCYNSGCKILFNKIINNTASGSSSYGGGLTLLYTSSVQIVKNNFIDNSATILGGGIYDRETSGTIISNNHFIRNSTNPNNSAGGGIFCSLSDSITVTGNVFQQNSGYQCGGLGSQDSDLLLINNIFTENQAYEAGAVGVSQFYWPRINRIINNTFTGNVADIAGGIELEVGLQLKALNNIFWGNSAPFAPEIYVKGGTMDIAYSNIRFGVDSIQVGSNATLNWLDGNIDFDPLLIADSLSNSSPCINTGIHSYEFVGGMICYCPPEDINGRLRPYPAGSHPDIGAWESKEGVVRIKPLPITKIPLSYLLHQNYPNPFNPSTTIEFDLPKTSEVSLKVFNILGEEVATLVSDRLSAGSYSYEWDASKLASGVYLYRLETEGFVQTKKMILMK
jgi:predicted GH43/DUF377 family glycosyl hydrolase